MTQYECLVLNPISYPEPAATSESHGSPRQGVAKNVRQVFFSCFDWQHCIVLAYQQAPIWPIRRTSRASNSLFSDVVGCENHRPAPSRANHLLQAMFGACQRKQRILPTQTCGLRDVRPLITVRSTICTQLVNACVAILSANLMEIANSV